MHTFPRIKHTVHQHELNAASVIAAQIWPYAHLAAELPKVSRIKLHINSTRDIRTLKGFVVTWTGNIETHAAVDTSEEKCQHMQIRFSQCLSLIPQILHQKQKWLNTTFNAANGRTEPQKAENKDNVSGCSVGCCGCFNVLNVRCPSHC